MSTQLLAAVLVLGWAAGVSAEPAGAVSSRSAYDGDPAREAKIPLHVEMAVRKGTLWVPMEFIFPLTTTARHEPSGPPSSSHQK